MKKYFYILVILGLCFKHGNAQFQTGLSIGNYSGIMGVTINPASTNYLNNGTDFMLFNYNTSILNNGYYMDPKPITQLLSPEIFKAFGKNADNKNESVNQTFDRIFNLRRSLKPNNYIFADATVYGPSILINSGKHSFGLLTAFKASESTVNLPPEMAIFLLKGASAIELQGKSFELNKVASGTLVYTDVAFNYSYEIADTYKSKHRLGITAHYLNGINSIVFEDLGKTKWTYIGDSTVLMENGNIIYNYAATKSADFGELLSSRGKGFAFDIGYTYLRKKKSRPTRLTVCPNIRFGGKIREYQDYKWRFGFALMDIGRIQFTNQTVSNKYENANGPTKNLDQSFYLGVFALDRKMRFDYAQNAGTKYTLDKQYTHYTATRFNFQFDYNFKNNIYFNLSGSQRLPIPNTISLYAPNILSLSARYEKQMFEVGLPISLIEYQYPVFGLNFRYGPFYMGTNHLLEMVGIRKVKGTDIFFGLKLNLSNFRGV
ncbi:MAG: DUF5723 family protein [bacterium]|nr:DUF5723 family protein [bacterium]